MCHHLLPFQLKVPFSTFCNIFFSSPHLLPSPKFLPSWMHFSLVTSFISFWHLPSRFYLLSSTLTKIFYLESLWYTIGFNIIIVVTIAPYSYGKLLSFQKLCLDISIFYLCSNSYCPNFQMKKLRFIKSQEETAGFWLFQSSFSTNSL